MVVPILVCVVVAPVIAVCVGAVVPLVERSRIDLRGVDPRRIWIAVERGPLQTVVSAARLVVAAVTVGVVVGAVVAVGVGAVVPDLDRVRVCRRHSIVAVARAEQPLRPDLCDILRARPGVAVGVVVAPRVAVCVGAVVPDLDRVRVDQGIGVVTVALDQRSARGLRAGLHGAPAVRSPAVAVGVLDPGEDIHSVALIGHPVAVFIAATTALIAARVDRRVGIVAVAAICRVPLRGLAGLRGVGRRAVAVPVGVGVPGQRVERAALVDLPVAVIVEPVAQLRRARVDSR